MCGLRGELRALVERVARIEGLFDHASLSGPARVPETAGDIAGPVAATGPHPVIASALVD